MIIWIDQHSRVVTTYISTTEDYLLPDPSVAVYSMDQSVTQFCFNVTIVDDNDYEGLMPEQLTLIPFSASTPNLIQPPLPNVTILIQDNEG